MTGTRVPRQESDPGGAETQGLGQASSTANDSCLEEPRNGIPSYTGADDDVIHWIAGRKKDSKHYVPKKSSWAELVGLLSFAEGRKDCGGYVPIAIRKTESLCGPGDARVPHVGHHRTLDAIRFCSLITLDSDAADPDFPERVAALGLAGLVHPTWSHDPDNGVFKQRALIRIDRPMSAADKRIATRHLMRRLGWHQFPDVTCASGEHFMHWPARPDPSDFQLTVLEGDLLGVDLAVMVGDLEEAQESPERVRPKPVEPGTPASAENEREAQDYLDNCVASVAGCPEGSRNSRLWGQCRMLFGFALGGCLDADQVREQMTEAGIESGMDYDEVAGTIKKAFDKATTDGPSHPELAETVFSERTGARSMPPALTPQQAADLTRLRAYALRSPKRARWAARTAIESGVPRDAVRRVFKNGATK